MRSLLLLLTLTSLSTAQVPEDPNVLLIIADDLGYDLVGAYVDAYTAPGAPHPPPANTPILDGLAANGMLFTAAYSDPVCSPSRVGLMTGHYGSDHLTSPNRAHFIGAPVWWDCTENGTLGGDAIAPTELPFLPALAPPSYRTGMVGKLHWDHEFQGEYPQTVGPGPMPPCNPNPGDPVGARNIESAISRGFERYAGAPNGALGPEAGPLGYFAYTHIEAAVGTAPKVTTSTKYITSGEVDDALRMIHEFADDPWFVTVSFHAPHRPFHAPPAHLHSLDPVAVQAAADYLAVNNYTPGDATYAANARLSIRAMAEAMDTEIGRLLTSMPAGEIDDTIVLFVSDNGTPLPTFQPEEGTDPFDDDYALRGAKADVYEGGIRVPFIVSGAGVPRQLLPMEQLVNLQDLHATILDLMGTSAAASVPSISIVPYFNQPTLGSLRPAVYSRRHRLNGPPPGFIGNPPVPTYVLVRETARIAQFKLIRRREGGVLTEEFYNLDLTPKESTVLPLPWTTAQQAAYTQLAALLQLPAP